MEVKQRKLPNGRWLPAGCFILINLLIQVIGYFASEGFPQFLFSLSDCILLMTPLLFGMAAGLLCLLPAAVFELIWTIQLHSLGPLFHALSFFLMIVVLALIFKKLSKLSAIKRCVLTGLLYEASLLVEEALYYLFRYLFLPSHKPISWAPVSGTFLSWANPLILCIGVVIIIILNKIDRRS